MIKRPRIAEPSTPNPERSTHDLDLKGLNSVDQESSKPGADISYFMNDINKTLQHVVEEIQCDPEHLPYEAKSDAREKITEQI